MRLDEYTSEELYQLLSILLWTEVTMERGLAPALEGFDKWSSRIERALIEATKRELIEKQTKQN